MKVCRKIVLLAFVSLFLLSATLGTSFITQVAYEQTISDPVDPFPQAGKFYTLAGRTVLWEIVDGKNITSHAAEILKWSVQDVVSDVAFVNWTYVYLLINPETGENYTYTYDFDYQIATNRTILSAYAKWMAFTTTGFWGSGGRPLDEDVGEHTWAWFPTNLSIGDYVLVSWTNDNSFLDDMLYEVVDDEVVQVVGEKQDCWMLRMPPSITIDGARVRTETYWVDKDTGVPVKVYGKEWALDGSSGWEMEEVLVNTNIDLGPESTQTPSPTYTLTVPTTPGFPEAGKFWSWYILYEGWYMNGVTNVTYYAEELLSCWVVNVTDNKALVYIIYWDEYLCEAQGVEQLEYVDIFYHVYSIDIATREILDVNGTVYVVNMTSLAYGGPWDETPLLAGDIGEETYCWLPTNLYIGAAVNITIITDRPWKVDNGTCTVVDEEIISALGQPQACWVLYMPPTPSIDGTWNHSRTYYSDKDVGILLELVGEGWAVNGSEAYEYVCQLIDTNVDLGAPPDTTPPVIENVYQQPGNDSVTQDDEVFVYANVTDDQTGVKKVTLNYTDGDGNWTAVYMTNLEGNTYNGTIPPFPYCTNVTYVIIAEDNANNTITTEEMGYEYKYHVIPEFQAAITLSLFTFFTLIAVALAKKIRCKVIPKTT